MPDATPSDDLQWMASALDEARRGLGLTSPNPPVGAVIVKEGRIIGTGYHRKAGEAHAEVNAIADAKERNPKLLSGATIYVTLEPCSTEGRTPPCTQALINAKLARVVYGARDPNPKHQGSADTVLNAARISVTNGVREKECTELLRPFAKWVTTGIPWVIAKSGQSLDGRITRPPGESSWITSDAARSHGHRLRVRVDAILVGAETVRRDNPHLTLRDGSAMKGKEQPWRVIMTRSGDIPPESHVLTDAHRERTLIMQGKELDEVLRELGQRGVLSVLIEGGGIIMGQAFQHRLVDEVVWYVAPRLCGGGRPSVAGLPLPASVSLDPVKVQIIGDNVCFHGFPVWPASTPPPLPV
jgi:diaminohydroxyphosphoribosylaminopyrimidine deaminase / 5-amino-6-(5-phosphoribosylamino)uracil reductase